VKLMSEVVHHCPEEGQSQTKCCGRIPFELPLDDRMSSDPRAVTCPTGTGTIERHVRIDDVKAHINKLGSPYLTGLVAWYLITLLDRGNCEGIVVIADELLQIPVPEGENAS